eukprot:scaffold4600_cov169-Amphora_coffeaeformis.AAC.11
MEGDIDCVAVSVETDSVLVAVLLLVVVVVVSLGLDAFRFLAEGWRLRGPRRPAENDRILLLLLRLHNVSLDDFDENTRRGRSAERDFVLAALDSVMVDLRSGDKMGSNVAFIVCPVG